MTLENQEQIALQFSPKETELNDNRIKYFIVELNKVKPKVIDGFPSALTEISKYILKKKYNIGEGYLRTFDQLSCHQHFDTDICAIKKGHYY